MDCSCTLRSSVRKLSLLYLLWSWTTPATLTDYSNLILHYVTDCITESPAPPTSPSHQSPQSAGSAVARGGDNLPQVGTIRILGGLINIPGRQMTRGNFCGAFHLFSGCPQLSSRSTRRWFPENSRFNHPPTQLSSVPRKHLALDPHRAVAAFGAVPPQLLKPQPLSD